MSKAVQAQARLTQLLENGYLAASACSSAFINLVQPLVDSGVLQWQRSGAGRRLTVVDSSTLAEFITSRFPGAGGGVDALRIRATGDFRDSKALPNNAPEIATFRVWKDSALQRAGEPFGAAGWTQAHGVCAVQISGLSTYSVHGSCAVVENPALFFEIERLGLPLALALLVRGRASDRLLSWLGAQKMGTGKIVHFPDYDPVGLSEYLRIKKRLSSAVQLYIPADIRARFARFSNPALLHPLRSTGILASLRASTDPEVQPIVSLIDHFGAGLEQEALLLPT